MKNNASEPLVIMTQASTDSFEYLWLAFKSKLKKILNRDFSKRQAPGHSGVVRSALEGLKKLNTPYLFNPKHENDISGNVVVLSGHDALKQAIRLKNRGQINKLFAGPNLVVSPKDAIALFSSNAIDSFIVNSQWVQDFYSEELPSLKNSLFIWPSGTDSDFWSPSNNGRPNQILIYNKNIDTKIISKYTDQLTYRGISYELINYGYYKPKEYYDLLNQSQTMLYFSQSESQGLALLEAWSMDVPTYVWNGGIFTFDGRKVNSSPAPYLSEVCGVFFEDAEDFFNQYKKHDALDFKAREWVLANGTDKVSAKNLVQHFNLLQI